MKIRLCVLFTIRYLFVSVLTASEKNQNALIFDSRRNALIALPSLIKNTEDSEDSKDSEDSENSSRSVKCETWAAACPAADTDEDNFQEKYSFHTAALFVHGTYRGKKSCADFQNHKCTKPYELSMAWFLDAIEFGYEIYVEQSKALRLGFNISVYDDYESLKTFLELKPLSWREFFDHLRKIYNERKQKEVEELEMQSGKKMKFTWIPLFKIWFKSNRFRKIEYQIRENNVDARLSCADYSLGNELFYGADVDSLYSAENQEKILKNLKLPSNTEDNGCESKYNCFSKWLLIPTDQFQFHSSSPILCSNIATVPIWTSTIKPILQKLDDYLYTLSRVTGQPLRIVAGASEVIKFPRAGKAGWFFSNSIKFTQEDKFYIPAPNIIYKIVKFKIDQCDVGPDLICPYGVIIIIHNNPFFDGINLICDDLTEELGWSEIKYAKLSSEEGQKPSKYIYVCAINRKSIEGVGLAYNWNLFTYRLSLVEFPDRDTEEFATKNVKDDVFKELKRLYEGAKVDVYDEVIERPAIYDVNFDFPTDDDDENENLNSESEGISEEQSKKHV